MKKAIYMAGIFAALLMTACAGGGENAEAETEENATGAPKGMILFDFSGHGMPVAMYVPDTADAMFMVEFNGQGKLEVKVGKNFQVQIGEGGDLELRKMDLSEDLVFVADFLVEDPNGIVYKQSVPDAEAGVAPQHHFYVVMNVNGMDYEVEDIQAADPYSAPVVQRMYESAKLLTAAGTPAS